MLNVRLKYQMTEYSVGVQMTMLMRDTMTPKILDAEVS